MNSNAPLARTERFPEDTVLLIDVIRGLAALMVLFTHAFDLSVVDAYGWDLKKNPDIWRLARAIFGDGAFGVWCFFIISGMCIHQSIARSIESGTFRWRSYVLARVTRIYPLFLLGLVLAVVAWELHEDWSELGAPHPWPQLFASLLSLQIFTSTFPSFSTSWSLSCEVIYYAAWPVLLLIFKGRASKAAYLAITGSYLALGIIAIAWQYSQRVNSSTAVDGLWTTMVLFPVWVAGAWLGANWRKTGLRVTRQLWIASLLLCLVAEVFLVVLKYRLYPGWALHMVSWISVPGLMVFFAGAHHPALSKQPAWKPVAEWLGRLSYPCYILHMQLLLILHHFTLLWLPKSITSHPLIYLPFLLLPLLALMVLIGPPMESRVMAWRSRMLGRPTQA